jgi:hypothetical protein
VKRAAGVPESVAMDIQGWKSPAMFRRYGIVDNSDRLDALNRVEQYEERLQFGDKFGDNATSEGQPAHHENVN